MKITSLYSPNVITADRSETMATVAHRMSRRNIGALPVIDGARLVGVISERDLVRAVARGYSSDTPVGQCMSEGAAWIDRDADSSEAAHHMLALGVRHLPVVDDGRIVGMISARDLLALEAWPTRR
jgi:CBS domain-containing protein